ncbi:MAG: glycerol kinase GlpK [Deltaproteobacteria bacterium]|nr:glycerol kinase GlpK [Candidatus Zymogenaceae bacterium]
MQKEYIMAIDQGTTGSRVYIFNDKGEVVGSAYKEFTQIYPRPGWVEHNPLEIYKSVQETMLDACVRSEVELTSIYAIGITNQRETTVLWDRKTGEPIHNAVVWQCRRTADICDDLKKRGYEELFKKKTGLVLDAYFSGTKVKWILDNVKGSRDRARKGEILFGTIDTWLMYKLSGGTIHATDYTNASRTLLFNIEQKQWDNEILDILDIPERVLPEVKNSAGNFGNTASVLPMGREVPITGVAGDQQAALFGQGCTKPGTAKNTYGTGCFLLSVTDGLVHSHNGLLTTIACSDTGKPVYALEGAVFIAGAVIQWLRDELGIIRNAAETDELARKVADTNGVYIVPAFVGLGAPYWDMHARGGILGITRGANRSHIVRAALEAIAYQARDLVEVINEESGKKLSTLRVDGGAANNDFLMQFQADILGIPVDRPKMTETTAAGAAYLAGLGSKFWNSASDLGQCRRIEKVFKPNMEKSRRDRLYSGWKEAVKRVSTK